MCRNSIFHHRLYIWDPLSSSSDCSLHLTDLGEARAADKDKKDDDGKAQDDEKAIAGYQDNAPTDNNTCADASQGAGDNDTGAAFKQDSTFRWYRIPWVTGSTKCKCAGQLWCRVCCSDPRAWPVPESCEPGE